MTAALLTDAFSRFVAQSVQEQEAQADVYEKFMKNKRDFVLDGPKRAQLNPCVGGADGQICLLEMDYPTATREW